MQVRIPFISWHIVTLYVVSTFLYVQSWFILTIRTELGLFLCKTWRRMGNLRYRSTHSESWYYVCVVSFTPRLLYFQGKGLRHPLNWRLSGLQSRFGRFGEHINFFSLPWIELCPSRNIVTLVTELWPPPLEEETRIKLKRKGTVVEGKRKPAGEI